ncbi:MAG: DUF429 domain-containing protein [Bdellovibrionota bacterium]
MSTKCGLRATDRLSTSSIQTVDRYLGLSLGGAKSDRTCLTVVDYYRKQEKAFVVDIFDSIGAEDDLTGDQVLLSLVEEVSGEVGGRPQSGVKVFAVDAPLTLPPCLSGCEEGCQGYETCRRTEVKWMRNQFQKAKAKNSKTKHFTPYGQRPVDLYFRYKHPEEDLFQDETMGANLAPQAARMNYLKRHWASMQLIEVWPKLTLYYLQKSLRLTRKEVLSYRHLERGAGIRNRILERLAEVSNIFIYERDLKKFISNISAFDSFLCAWVAMQYDLERVMGFRSDLPLESGWVQLPEL